MLFKQNKKDDNKLKNIGEQGVAHQFSVVQSLEKSICGACWHEEFRISRIAGMSMGGLRSASLLTNEQLNEQSEALTCLAQKTLPLVLHVKDLSVGNSQTLRLPFFRFFASSAQQSADFTLIARRLAESAILPVMVVHTGHENAYVHPSAALVKHFLGAADDNIETPTPAQQLLFGDQRRRIPEFWNIDQPLSIGLTMPAALRDRHGGAQRTFFIEPMINLLADILREFTALTGRDYPAAEFLTKDAAHWVVTTEAVPETLPRDLPLVKINYASPALPRQLKGKKLTFVDRNFSRALGPSLGLSGYSLIHYGSIDEDIVAAALSLNDDQPTKIAGVRYLYPSPLTPKEEIYNQQVREACGIDEKIESQGQTEAVSIAPPLALSRHPNVELPLADLHRFWAQNGKYLTSAQPEKAVATPILATGLLPAGSGKMWRHPPDITAVRVVEPADLIAALINRMNRENYAVDTLESYARPLTQNIKARLFPGADFATVMAEAFAAVLAGAGAASEALTKQWRNACYFLPPSCQLVDPYVGQGGILIRDDAPDFQETFDLLPNTQAQFLQRPDSVLLDKDGFASFVRMEKTAEQEIHHLFSAVACVEAKHKAKKLLQQVEASLDGLKLHLSRKLSVTLSGDIEQALTELTHDDLTIAELAQKLDKDQVPVDRQWLLRLRDLQQRLEGLREKCKQSVKGEGRASHGVVSQNAAGIYPWSPVIVPWAQNGNGEGVELALGLWEAHMEQLLGDFIALRQCALELAQRYNPRIHDAYFASFDWRQLNQEELSLCPPLVLTGTDSDFFRSGGSLNELLRAGAPVKVLAFDTLRANPAAPLQHLLAFDIYVLRGSLADKEHLLYGMSEAFSSSKPALMQVLSPQVKNYLAFSQLAHENGLYALFCGCHDDLEDTALNLHPMAHLDNSYVNGMTFADLVFELPAFVRHFNPIETSYGASVAEYLELDEDDRVETLPIVERVDADGKNKRYQVSQVLIQRVEEQQRFKVMLSHFTPADADAEAIASAQAFDAARQQVLASVTQSLIEWARPVC